MCFPAVLQSAVVEQRFEAEGRRFEVAERPFPVRPEHFDLKRRLFGLFPKPRSTRVAQ